MSADIREFTFKTVGNLEIGLDVHLPPGASKENPAPLLLWWHGGGLLQGSRKRMPPHLARCPTTHGIALVSADYRLAPQTPLPEILSDVADAVTFVRERLPALVDGRVDPARFATCGSSAGGFLSLLVGVGKVGVQPPKVTTAIYPITDTTDAFWTTPQQPKVTYEDAPIPRDFVAPFLDRNAPAVAENAADSNRRNMYSWMLQSGTLNSLLLPEGSPTRPEDYIVASLIRSLSSSSTLPTIWITHGTVDQAVPVSQARAVVQALKERGAEIVYGEVEGKDHLWDEEDGKVELEGLYALLKERL